MALSTLFTDTDQDAASDELKRNRDVLTSAQFADTAALIAAHGNLDVDDWVARFDTAFERLRAAAVVRDRGAAGQSTKAEDVSTQLTEIDLWFDDAERTLRQATKRGVPGARELYRDVARAPGTEDTYRDLSRPLDIALTALAEAGDLTRFGLLPDHLERGKTLRATVDGERAALHGNQVGISAGALTVHYLLDELTDLMEELNDAHEIAQGRLRRELPGFDLRYVRAARARRNTARLAAATAPATPTPPAAPVAAGDDAPANGL